MSPRPLTRRRYLRAAGALALASLGGCVLSTEPYVSETDRSFDLGGADTLVVANSDGDVSLDPGDGDTVSGTVRKESRSGRDALDDVAVEATASEGQLRVETVYERDVNVSVDVDLSVPEGLSVARVATENGDATVTDLPGDVTCLTDNGDATADGVDGFVTVRSTSGDAIARETAGVDGAGTTNGDVDVDVQAVRGDVALRSTNGDVTAAVADDLSVTVDLSTTNGDADAGELPLATEESTETRVRGRLGEDPEHVLSLETVNGDVSLEPL